MTTIILILVLALLSSTRRGLVLASDPTEERLTLKLERAQAPPEQLGEALEQAMQDFESLQRAYGPLRDGTSRWQLDAQSGEELQHLLDRLLEITYDALAIGYWDVLGGGSGVLAATQEWITRSLESFGRDAVLPSLLAEFGAGGEPPIHTYIAVQHARLIFDRVAADLKELSQLEAPLVADRGVAEQIFEAVAKARLLHHYSSLWVASLGELSFNNELPRIPKLDFQRCEPLQLSSHQLGERVERLYDDFMQSMPEALNALAAGICPQLCQLLLGLILRTLNTLFLARSLTSVDWSSERPEAPRWRLVARLSADVLIHVRKWVAGLLAKTTVGGGEEERWWYSCLWGNHPWASWSVYISPVFGEQTQQVPPEWLHDLDDFDSHLDAIVTMMGEVPSIDRLVERILELKERLLMSRHSTSDDLGYFVPRERLLMGALRQMVQPSYARRVFGGQARQISDYAKMVWQGLRLIIVCDLFRSTAHEARWGLNNVVCCLTPYLSPATDVEEVKEEGDEASRHLLADVKPTGGRSFKSASRAIPTDDFTI